MPEGVTLSVCNPLRALFWRLRWSPYQSYSHSTSPMCVLPSRAVPSLCRVYTWGRVRILKALHGHCKGLIALDFPKISTMDVSLGYWTSQFPSQGSIKKPGGTPLYVAPEHFMQTVGLESDMWSLGMLFYQLLCGRLPFADAFRAKSPMDVMMAILSEDVKFEGPRWGCISKDAQTLIMQMLDRDYNSRVTHFLEKTPLMQWLPLKHMSSLFLTSTEHVDSSWTRAFGKVSCACLYIALRHAALVVMKLSPAWRGKEEEGGGGEAAVGSHMCRSDWHAKLKYELRDPFIIWRLASYKSRERALVAVRLPFFTQQCTTKSAIKICFNIFYLTFS